MAKAKSENGEFTIKARVLLDVTIRDTAYKANQVGEFSQDEINQYESVLDASESAVEYAESLIDPNA